MMSLWATTKSLHSLDEIRIPYKYGLKFRYHAESPLSSEGHQS